MQSKNYIIVYQFAEEMIIVLLRSEHEAPRHSSRTGNGTRKSVYISYQTAYVVNISINIADAVDYTMQR